MADERADKGRAPLTKAHATAVCDGRKRREEKLVVLRSSRREDMLAKKRREGAGGVGIPTAVPDPSLAGLGRPEAEPVVEPLDYELLARMIQSPNSEDQLAATERLRKALSMEHNPPIADVVSTPVFVPRLVEFLRREDNWRLQFEAAWALTNIASGTEDQTCTVIRAGAVPIFVDLLRSPHDDVKEQAVWALGNIAGDSLRCRDYVLSLGVMGPLISILGTTTRVSIVRNVTWTISNLCRFKPLPETAVVQPALQMLARLLFYPDEDVLVEACWAVSYLSDGTSERLDAVLELGIEARLMELLTPSTMTGAAAAVLTPALRIVGNVVTGNDRQTQSMIAAGALPKLLTLLTHPRRSIRKETCWAISNITAGNPAQIQSVLDVGIIPPLVAMLRHADHEVRKEAAWALSNATAAGKPEQIQRLVADGVIVVLVEQLMVPDCKVVQVALEGLDNILRVGEEAKDKGHDNPYITLFENAGGCEKLEMLQGHRHQEIVDRAVTMLESYFDTEQFDEYPMGDGGAAQPAAGVAPFLQAPAATPSLWAPVVPGGAAPPAATSLGAFSFAPAPGAAPYSFAPPGGAAAAGLFGAQAAGAAAPFVSPFGVQAAPGAGPFTSPYGAPTAPQGGGQPNPFAAQQ